MRLRRAHPVICTVVLAVYLLNLAFAASGAVLCRDFNAQQTRLEIACDHSHCGDVTEIEHDHTANESCACSCATCTCDDTSLGITVTASLNRDGLQGMLANSFNCVLTYEEPATLPGTDTLYVVLRLPSPAVIQQLRHIRTIVLIV